jgi:hypothetical protein
LAYNIERAIRVAILLLKCRWHFYRAFYFRSRKV